MRKVMTSVLGIAAVLWIGYTLYAVVRFGGAVVMDHDTTARIMAVRNGEQVHSSLGLTYHGLAGAALVVGEVFIVLVALAAGLLGSGRRRLAGLLALACWTALWLGNAVWLQSRGWDRGRDVALMGAAMLVVLLWAGLRATAPANRPANDPAPAT
ncbi:MAG: hypothetical protein ACYTJ0_08560 [Planctomycetota bacterium]|jgi:hypothetical protein